VGKYGTVGRPQMTIKYGSEIMKLAYRKTKKLFVFSTSMKIYFIKL
jgi:hypothetical protein